MRNLTGVILAILIFSAFAQAAAPPPNQEQAASVSTQELVASITAMKTEVAKIEVIRQEAVALRKQLEQSEAARTKLMNQKYGEIKMLFIYWTICLLCLYHILTEFIKWKMRRYYQNRNEDMWHNIQKQAGEILNATQMSNAELAGIQEEIKRITGKMEELKPPEKRGFFSRLFGRKKTPVEAVKIFDKPTIEEVKEEISKASGPEITTKTEGYCLKCKKHVEISKAEITKNKNGTNAIKGTCPVCGTKVFRILKKQK